MTDTVGDIVQQWRRERPDLDASPMLVVGRILRLAHLLDTALRPLFASAGLAPGDFDVLAALRRAGPSYSRTPSELRDALLVTSGAVTKQVDRLIAAGLVTREIDPDDGRGRRVILTEAGVAMVDELIAAHLANQQRLLSGLAPIQHRQLERALAAFAAQLETTDP